MKQIKKLQRKTKIILTISASLILIITMFCSVYLHRLSHSQLLEREHKNAIHEFMTEIAEKLSNEFATDQNMKVTYEYLCTNTSDYPFDAPECRGEVKLLADKTPTYSMGQIADILDQASFEVISDGKVSVQQNPAGTFKINDFSIVRKPFTFDKPSAPLSGNNPTLYGSITIR